MDHRRPLMKTFLITLTLVGFGGTAVADDGPDFSSVKGAVVIVIARGIDPSRNNQEIEVRGTGFFINKDGYLVTSYHLRTMLGAVDESTVSYEIQFGSANDRVSAAYAWHLDASGDIMLLFASVADRNVPILKRGSRNGISLGVTKVYTAGYPAGWQWTVEPGVVKSFGLLDPIPAWATSIKFKEGQSGSPILREDKSVIAIVKGNDKDTGVVLPVIPIPINYWESP